MMLLRDLVYITEFPAVACYNLKFSSLLLRFLRNV
jgi:hypothetical protein